MDRKGCAIDLKAIPDDIIAERKEVDMSLKCRKGCHKWF